MIGKTEGTDVRTRTSGIADGRLKTELPRDRPACGLPPRPVRAGCKNEPNGAEPIVQNKANPGGAGWVGAQGAWAARCKTNPIRGHGARDEAGGTRGDCAKQTQLPETGHRGAVREQTGRDQGARSTNKANFGLRIRRGKYFADNDLRRILHANGLGKTEPIRGWAGSGKGRQACLYCRWGQLYDQSQFSPKAGMDKSRQNPPTTRSGAGTFGLVSA